MPSRLTERELPSSSEQATLPIAVACAHCGTVCGPAPLMKAERPFCCQGCQLVFELLTENGLGNFYELSENAGVRIGGPAKVEQYQYLDEPAVRERLVDFSNERVTRITFRIPAIHCIACVWLLENLYRLNPQIGESRVNFPRKEIALSFATDKVKLSEVVTLLASLGYEPELKLADLEARPKGIVSRKLWLQVGIAGFAFGNTMLFSLASYLGLDSASEPYFHKIFGWFSLALSLPVVIYSAQDYWRAAWVSLRQKLLTIEVPIAAGIVAIFLQSTYEVVSGTGEGYFDSLAGLLFFLLSGRIFQQKTYDRLAFDRDYKSFFPLSVVRKGKAEERIALSQIQTGDHLILRNGELIPADARLVAGPAVIDYSFVTGESEPVEKQAGEYLYAGGRQIGGAIEVETVKAVSQSYLTSLWNQEAFRKEDRDSLDNLTNEYSQRFTKLVLAIALGAAAYWAVFNPSLALKSFTAVLIVACPCALALAAPFTLGTAHRWLAKWNAFLKSAGIIERLARVDTIVFDKTGTLTAAGSGLVKFHGEPLSEAEERALFSMTRHSTHPLAVRLGHAIAGNHFPDTVRSFLETAGCGMEGQVNRQEIWMGSAAWLQSRGLKPMSAMAESGSVIQVAINGQYRGCYVLQNAMRPETDRLIQNLSTHYELALLSGDNERERVRFAEIFGAKAHLQFNQSPLNKLGFIRDLQQRGKTVMMVGDGLNDAGALKQSDVGVAVVEDMSAFSPASDMILSARLVPRIDAILRFAKSAVRVIKASFLVSAAYNVIGLALAVQGLLSPVVCAILMPVSSITVVGFACLMTGWMAKREGIGATMEETR